VLSVQPSRQRDGDHRVTFCAMRALAELPETLLGVRTPDRPTSVDEELSSAHAEVMRERMEAELGEQRLGAGPTPAEPADVWARLGPTPRKQVRRVFVAKFNPGESDPTEGRFLVSDPLAEPSLWQPGLLESWVSDQLQHTRHTPAHAAIEAGDLIFVFRSEPKVNGRVQADRSPLRGRPHLVGVWWALSFNAINLSTPRTGPSRTSGTRRSCASRTQSRCPRPGGIRRSVT